jgi:hypothetical protein
MPPGYGVYIPILMFAKSELWFQESVNCPPEGSFAGLSNKTVNLEDHRQKHGTSDMGIWHTPEFILEETAFMRRTNLSPVWVRGEFC